MVGFARSLSNRVGAELFVSEPFEVTQSDVDVFAAVTRDWDYMHNDPAWASRPARGGRPLPTVTSSSRC